MGHLAFNINGQIWSREKYGWNKEVNFSKYMADNAWRDAVGYVLDDPDNTDWAQSLAGAVMDFKGAWTPNRNCGEPFCNATRELGLPENNSLTPMEHRTYIQNKLRPFIKAINYYHNGKVTRTINVRR